MRATTASGGATFFVTYAGERVKGHIFCKLQPQGATVAVIGATDDASAAEWRRLLSVPAGATASTAALGGSAKGSGTGAAKPGAATASKGTPLPTAAVGPLRQHPFADGTGSIGLLPGWTTDLSSCAYGCSRPRSRRAAGGGQHDRDGVLADRDAGAAAAIDGNAVHVPGRAVRAAPGRAANVGTAAQRPGSKEWPAHVRSRQHRREAELAADVSGGAVVAGDVRGDRRRTARTAALSRARAARRGAARVERLLADARHRRVAGAGRDLRSRAAGHDGDGQGVASRRRCHGPSHRRRYRRGPAQLPAPATGAGGGVRPLHRQATTIAE